ncbi:MAG: hypothetical protein HRU70_07245 [Phycisphaeraceae bacterium]|nr:MAG: hypothetical protein HRU70_07245 [Phycisphaeraceae bacterium]
MTHTLSLLAVVIGAAAQPQVQRHPEPHDRRDTPPWGPASPRLLTRWAADVDPANPWPGYPRPTMSRDRWQSLNGRWSCVIVRAGADAPPDPDAWTPILVPFPVESSLSGVAQRLGPDDTLIYQRTFTIPDGWRSDHHRVRLLFGAVDWHARVSVNGAPVGEHKGGFDPFSFDITAHLALGDNTLAVEVKDPTDAGGQPRGKQWSTPHGIWYTPSSGIWQTVWLEPVPRVEIGGLHVTTQTDPPTVRVSLTHVVADDPDTGRDRVEVDVLAGDAVIARAVSPGPGRHAATAAIPDARLWSPDDPYLYTLRVRLFRDDRLVDQVTSYAGIRSVERRHDDSGVPRLFLNGKPIFHFGPLDQGFWPDGLYTPPTEEAMRFDIEAAKAMGANMLRKHVKVESERFYHLCDTLGVMVWQDIPSPFFHGGTGDNPHGNPPLTDGWKQQFEHETHEIVRDFRNHPSIVMWVPWNEGWGQNDLAWSRSIVDLVAQWDPARLVNCASGWTDTGNGDVLDIHIYPGPATTPPRDARVVVLGEYGGLGLPVEGHTWLDKNNWGYVSYPNAAELTKAYLAQLEQLPLLIAQGLAAAVYTQTTDVEIETNGWLTYDRAVWKIDPAAAAPLTRRLYQPPPSLAVLVPHAGQPGAVEGNPWRFTTTPPPEGWQEPGFDDSAWSTGLGGFGTKGTPGAVVMTEWRDGEIWLRRTVTLRGEADPTPVSPMLAIHHDEDAEVFIDGVPAGEFRGYTTAYRFAPIAPEAAAVLKATTTVTLAVRCRQTTGGQYIDVGLIDVRPGRDDPDHEKVR